MTRKRRFAPLIIVFAAALLVRGLYLVESADSPTSKIPVVDARTYDQMARDLIDRGKLSQDFFWQPPLYPFFLAGVYALTGGSMAAAKAVQAVVGALTAVLAFFLGARLFGRKAGFAAGLITAFYLPLVFFEGELLAAGWAAFLATALILGLLRAVEKPSLGRSFVVGLLGILGIATRPELLPFFIVGAVWLIFKLVRRDGFRLGVKALAPAAAGFLLIAVALGFVGKATTGKFRILPFSGGLNFYIGNNPDALKTVGIRPGYEWHKLIALPEKFGIRDIVQKEAYFRDRALDFARTQPGRFLGGLAYKARQFFTSREIVRNVDIYVFRSWSLLLRAGVWKWGRFGFPYGLLLALAAVGLAWRARSVPAPLGFFLALYPAAVVLIFVASRYRVPYVPALAVLAGGGVAAVGAALKSGKWKVAGLMALLMAGVAAASSLSAPFPEERLDYRAELSYMIGAALQTRGELGEAEASYEDALRRRPDYADAWYNFGVLKEKQGKQEDAIAFYLKAAEADPDYSDASYNLGVLYQARGMPEDAIEAYSEAIRIMPSDIFAHNNLATLLRASGDLEGAVRHYEAAIEVHPGFTAASNNLGYALSAMGRPDAAIEHFRSVLSAEPDSVPSLVGLSRALAARPGREPRDSTEAVLLADRAASLTDRRDPRVLKTLAEACAAAGDLGRAAAVARAAAGLAARTGAADLALELRTLADKYEASLEPLR